MIVEVFDGTTSAAGGSGVAAGDAFAGQADSGTACGARRPPCRARRGRPDPGYFSVGEPALLEELFTTAGLIIDQFTTWQSATRLDSVDTLLAVELLPLTDVVTDNVRERVTEQCGRRYCLSPSRPVPSPPPGGSSRRRLWAHHRGRW
jgi:hypothetical protein